MHQRGRQSRGRLAAASWLLFPSNPVVPERSRSRRLGKALELFPLYSLVLHHVHDHPVEGIDVLADEVLEHDECFHQEVLEEETAFGEGRSRRPESSTGWWQLFMTGLQRGLCALLPKKAFFH